MTENSHIMGLSLGFGGIRVHQELYQEDSKAGAAQGLGAGVM